MTSNANNNDEDDKSKPQTFLLIGSSLLAELITMDDRAYYNRGTTRRVGRRRKRSDRRAARNGRTAPPLPALNFGVLSSPLNGGPPSVTSSIYSTSATASSYPNYTETSHLVPVHPHPSLRYDNNNHNASAGPHSFSNASVSDFGNGAPPMGHSSAAPLRYPDEHVNDFESVGVLPSTTSYPYPAPLPMADCGMAHPSSGAASAVGVPVYNNTTANTTPFDVPSPVPASDAGWAAPLYLFQQRHQKLSSA